MIGLFDFTNTLKYIFYKYEAITKVPASNFANQTIILDMETYLQNFLKENVDLRFPLDRSLKKISSTCKKNNIKLIGMQPGSEFLCDKKDHLYFNKISSLLEPEHLQK